VLIDGVPLVATIAGSFVILDGAFGNLAPAYCWAWLKASNTFPGRPF
jgi:hypothetical protein